MSFRAEPETDVACLPRCRDQERHAFRREKPPAKPSGARALRGLTRAAEAKATPEPLPAPEPTRPAAETRPSSQGKPANVNWPRTTPTRKGAGENDGTGSLT